MKLAELFKKYQVKAESVEDFLDRYYKPRRYKGRGEEYAASLLASHQAHFEQHGCDFISRHDSATGEIVAFYGED